MKRSGALLMVDTLLQGGVDTCFTNPGTSEMHFVAALDQTPEMRSVLCLHETVATGAADGYARMADKPAGTLLHLGPGLANGLANVHNARRAKTPMVNIVGEHATYHRHLDSPLTSDIEAIAASNSAWVRTTTRLENLGRDTAEAIAFAKSPPGNISTLILPSDMAWTDLEEEAKVFAPALPNEVPSDRIEAAARIAKQLGEKCLFVLSGLTLRDEGLNAISKIAQATGARFLAQGSNGRIERGAERVFIDRVRYPIPQALDQLAGIEQVFLVNAVEPVGFFAYPGRPKRLFQNGCQIVELAADDENGVASLVAVADEIGGGFQAIHESYEATDLPTGRLNPDNIAQTLAALMPENAILADESITSGRGFFPYTKRTKPHTWLQGTGGAIGIGFPMATGAAMACPDRTVIAMQADGSGMYSCQALWTQARENLNVKTIILSNRAYAILKGEMSNLGFDNPGPRARDMLTLDNPTINWPQLANSMGVEAGRAETAEELAKLLIAALKHDGPFLIEALL
ncbi:acetolactate synthase large subunit [Alphaproteobacteria bacterium]|nr:acetolactate synthase large subunit [Alphaproteobacteria bacterium]